MTTDLLGNDIGLAGHRAFAERIEANLEAADEKRLSFGWPDIDQDIDALGCPKTPLDYLASVLAWHMAAPEWTTDRLDSIDIIELGDLDVCPRYLADMIRGAQARERLDKSSARRVFVRCGWPALGSFDLGMVVAVALPVLRDKRRRLLADQLATSGSPSNRQYLLAQIANLEAAS